MIINYHTLRKIIYSLSVVMVITFSFGHFAFVPPRTAEAQWITIDPGQIATTVATSILERLLGTDLATMIVEGEFDSETFGRLWDWGIEQITTILAGAAVRIIADFLGKQVEKLVQDRRIQSFLYYADYLAYQVYLIDDISKRYPDDWQGRVVYMYALDIANNNLGRGSAAADAVRAQIYSDPDCQTWGLDPRQPNYYERMIRSGQAKCNPVYTMAALHDEALNVLSRAERAASMEIAQSQGYQSTRDCGFIASTDFTDIARSIRGIGQDNDEGITEGDAGSQTGGDSHDQGDSTVPLPRITPTEGNELSYNYFDQTMSIVCSAIVTPGQYTSTLIQEGLSEALSSLTDGAIDIEESGALSAFLQNTLATQIHAWIWGSGREGESVVRPGPGGINLATANPSQINYDFVSQVPGGLSVYNYIDRLQSRFGIDAGVSSRADVLSTSQMRDFWNNVCTQSLPLLYSFRSKDFPNQSASTPTGAFRRVEVYEQAMATEFGDLIPLLGRNRNNATGYTAAQIINIIDNWPPLGDYRLEEIMLNQEVPFGVRASESGGFLGLSNTTVTFPHRYLWTVGFRYNEHDDVVSSFVNKDRYLSIRNSLYQGRMFALTKSGLPTAQDMNRARQWIPEFWPYFVSADRTKAFQFHNGWDTYNTSTGRTIEIPNLHGDPISPNNTRVYEVNRNSEGVFQTTLTEINNRTVTNASTYTINNDSVVMWPPVGGSIQYADRSMWLAQRNVNVTVSGDAVIVNPEGLNLNPNQTTYIVEFTDAQGQKQFMSAQKLQLQQPCREEIPGPPFLVNDFETKLSLSEAVAPDLWDWVRRSKFVTGLMTGGDGDTISGE